MLVNKVHDNTIRWREGERLDHLFEQACDDEARTRAGADIAVSTDEGDVSFRELDNLANQAARYLRKRGIEAGDRVGILVNKSLYTYVALLAVLKNNAAFVPLDAGFPRDRIGFILSDAQVKTVVTVAAHEQHVSGLGADIVLLDTARAEIDAQDPSRPTPEERGDASDQLAYIIYTSGSTGNPKGVACEHPSACNFVAVAAETYGIRSDDRMYQGMTIAFDFSFEELWVPLVAGATLVPGRPDTNLLGADLHDYLVERGVTALACVPTLLATIEDDLPDLRFLLVSGEACPRDLVNRWHRPGRIFLNAYGPTEAAVTATITEVHPDKGVTIGGPLPTYTIVILEPDEAKQVPDGGTGEICIAGIALARGYVNRDELTEKVFIPDFLDIPNNPSGRIYRTGDLGRINEDGEIEFLGRIDLQVKVRGYRIELTEIESVFMEAPGVALAVVDTWEPEPGVIDLVAYYTLKDGVDELARDELAALLRSRLPSYMIPSFVEKLEEIPMLPSQKADRKKLPAPAGPRFVAVTKDVVAPRNDTEAAIAEALGGILGFEEISVVDHFFNDLGAHSLLMAQLSAALRARLPQASVSMRDIYLNPSVEQLARLIGESAGGTADKAEEEIYRIPSALEYYGCGALQGLTYILGSIAALWVFIASFKWTFTPTDMAEIYMRMVGLGLGLLAMSIVVPILLKWVLVGRWTEQEFPVWSLRYFRFWVVKRLVQSNPMAFFAGSPVYNVYLRLLGARIGKNVHIKARFIPVCTDLISIGDNTVLRGDSMLLGYKAQSGLIRTGPVSIGAGAFVGEGSVLDIGTVMEDGAQLGHASSLHTGQRIPAGKRFHGSPAIETDTDFNTVEPRPCTALRKFVYFAAQIVVGFAVVAPVSFLVMYKVFLAFFEGHDHIMSLSNVVYPPSLDVMAVLVAISAVLFLGGHVVGLIVAPLVPRLLGRFIEEDRTYVLYGIHYFLASIISSATNSAYFNTLFGDSSYIVHYLRWIGYRLGRYQQTGSNFGNDQKQDNPLLCEVGRGTMVSDGVALINTQTSSTSFRMSRVRIAENNFLGNNIYFPSTARTGANCLLATKVMVPVDGPVRENVGLLGSPSFEIPRSVSRDKAFEGEDAEKRRIDGLRAKNIRNFFTILSVLALNLIYLSATVIIGYCALWLYLSYGFAAVALYPTAFAVFTITYFAVVARWSWTGSPMDPKTISIYDPYFWKVEHYWKRASAPVNTWYKGTPFRNLVSRITGIRIGARVFDDGCFLSERPMVEIGDYCTLNEASVIQCHSLEDAVFKSDRVTIGTGCTLSVVAFAQYGAVMGDNSTLDPDSFLMKGETVPANARWRGNPAQAV